MKMFFKKIGAFFKHVWTKYRDNWFKIIFYCLLVFIMSCAWFRSCKEDNKPQSTLTASADEVEQPTQRSTNLNPAGYAFNIFPYPYTVDLTGTPLEDIVTFGADGSIVLNGTLSTDDLNGNSVFGITFAVLNDTNSQLVGGRRYYYKSVPQVANQIAGIITNYRVGGLYSGSFDYVAGTDVNFTLRVTANTFNNFVISPALYYTDSTDLPWTPPISLLLNQSYDDGYINGGLDGYHDGYDYGYKIGSVDGFETGKSEGFIDGQNSIKLGIFYNSTLTFTINYNDGRTRVETFSWEDFIPSVGFHGIDIGEVFFKNGLYAWTPYTFFKNVVVTIEFDSLIPNSNTFYLTNLPQVSNFRYQLSTNEWRNTSFTDESVVYAGGYLCRAYALTHADSAFYKAVSFTYTYDTTGNNSTTPYYRGLAIFTHTDLFGQGLLQGTLNTKQKVDEAYTKGYNVGYNKGREVDSQGYTFLSLIDAIGYGVTKPFVSILNFDLLGMNMLSFVTGLLTLVFIVKLCSMFI